MLVNSSQDEGGVGGLKLRVRILKSLVLSLSTTRLFVRGPAQVHPPSLRRACVREPADHHQTAKGSALARMDRLTSRERDVVHLVADGMRNQEIANKLALSEHTIRNYLLRITTNWAYRAAWSWFYMPSAARIQTPTPTNE